MDILSEHQKENTHYSNRRLQPLTVITQHGIGFQLGNVIKYIARSKYKSKRRQDLLKALNYLNYLESEQNEWIRWQSYLNSSSISPEIIRDMKESWELEPALAKVISLIFSGKEDSLREAFETLEDYLKQEFGL